MEKANRGLKAVFLGYGSILEVKGRVLVFFFSSSAFCVDPAFHVEKYGNKQGSKYPSTQWKKSEKQRRGENTKFIIVHKLNNKYDLLL